MWQHLKTDGHVRKLPTLILIARYAFPVIQVAISSYVQVMDVTKVGKQHPE